MTVVQLDSGLRHAQKAYRCGMCGAVIHRGDLHSASANVYDGHAYTWRECLPCQVDRVCSKVHDWSGGWHDEGVDYELAQEWAEDAVRWSKSGDERGSARRWLARAAGGEGE